MNGVNECGKSRSSKRGGTALFMEGVRSGIPIAVGYLPIAVAFGLLARSSGVPASGAVAMSLIVFAGASQFMGVNLMAMGASVPEIVLATFILNFRHFLMSSTLTRRVASGTPARTRGLLAFGVTDETFSVASLRPEKRLEPSFLAGLFTTAYGAWNLGTFLGVFVAASIPEILQESMGIALYAMFIGLLVPSIRNSRPALIVALMAMAVNGLFTWLPALRSLSGGWGIMASTIVAAVAGAVLFPVRSSSHE